MGRPRKIRSPEELKPKLPPQVLRLHHYWKAVTINWTWRRDASPRFCPFLSLEWKITGLGPIVPVEDLLEISRQELRQWRPQAVDYFLAQSARYYALGLKGYYRRRRIDPPSDLDQRITNLTAEAARLAALPH